MITHKLIQFNRFNEDVKQFQAKIQQQIGNLGVKSVTLLENPSNSDIYLEAILDTSDSPAQIDILNFSPAAEMSAAINVKIDNLLAKEGRHTTRCQILTLSETNRTLGLVVSRLPQDEPKEQNEDSATKRPAASRKRRAS